MQQNSQRMGRICGVLSILVPMALLLYAYAGIGVYPFGEKTLLLADMDSEYIDYYAHFHRAVRQGESILRSWEMGMGLNMLGLAAFYTASPFVLLILLAPLEYLTEAVLAVTLLKAGLCGLFFYIYAGHTFRQLSHWVHFAAAAAYALCGYNLAYSSNLMWLDGVAFLPLVLLGADKILRDGKWGVFAGSLVYVFFTSYYIGYMIGLFSFLYFTARFFSENSDLRAYRNALMRFLGAAALAAGSCALLLLPAFFGLKNGQAALWSIPLSWSLEIPMTSLSAKLLPGVYDSLTDAGLPHIYVTVAGALGAVWFFLSHGVSRKEKLWWGALTAFMLLSFSCSILNLGWHAFEDPTWYPARYSFVFSFLLLFLALRGLAAGYPRPMHAWVGGAVLLLLFTEAGVRRLKFLQLSSVLLGIGLLAAYCVAAALGPGRKRGLRRIIAGAALVLVCAESGFNAVTAIKSMDGHLVYKRRESYTGFREDFQPAVDYLNQTDSGAWRMEVMQQRSANGGMALGYRGISHYSTTTDQRLNGFLQQLGYNAGTINELRCTVSTPLTNGLLGIRYLLSREQPGEGYKSVGTAGQVGIYENEAAFPLAFYADKDALSLDTDTKDPFLLQNRWLRALGGEDTAFLPLEAGEIQTVNLVRQKGDGFVQLVRAAKGEAGRLSYTLHNPTGQAAYAYLPVYGRVFARAKAFVNGKEVQRELGYRNNSVIPLGSEETVLLELEIYSERVRLSEPYFYALDLDAARDAARRAWDSAMEFTVFRNTRVEGMVTAPRAGTLVTSIPFDKGWTVYVDGERTQPDTFAGVFLALKLEAGDHEIIMKYWPSGFRPGCLITVVCVLVWGKLAWAGRTKQMK